MFDEISIYYCSFEEIQSIIIENRKLHTSPVELKSHGIGSPRDSAEGSSKYF
jgi:hypothetical protein